MEVRAPLCMIDIVAQRGLRKREVLAFAWEKLDASKPAGVLYDNLRVAQEPLLNRLVAVYLQESPAVPTRISWELYLRRPNYLLPSDEESMDKVVHGAISGVWNAGSFSLTQPAPRPVFSPHDYLAEIALPAQFGTEHEFTAQHRALIIAGAERAASFARWYIRCSELYAREVRDAHRHALESVAPGAFGMAQPAPTRLDSR